MEFLNLIYSSIQRLPVVIPAWVWTLLSMLFAGSMVYLALQRQWLKKKPKANKPVPPRAEDEAAETPSEERPEAARVDERNKGKGKGKGGWLAEFRLRRRFGKVCKDMLRLLKAEVRGRDYRYQIPWVLLAGEQDAGKSTLLSHLDLHKPFGPPPAAGAGCQPWLFDRGIVLDLDGRYLADATGGADEAGWRAFLKALRASRRRKPLEGIVLALSARALVRYPDGGDQIAAKAERIQRQLWTLQKEIGLRLPVYILITQSDLIEGFSAFSAAIPERLRDGIFGWSNPHSLDVEYRPGDAERAFNAIYRDINDLQLQLAAAGDDIEDRDAFLIFPHRFRPVFRHLQTYLDTIFRTSVYQESYFLRGIYFCGDALAEAPAVSPGMDLASDDLAFEPKLQDKLRSRQVLFLTHLFRDKVFAESGIAHPVTRSFLWELRRLRLLQVGFASLLVLLAGGQWFAYERLNRQKNEQLLPVFAQYQQDNRRIDTIRGELGDSFHAQAAALREAKLEGAQNLLSGMERMQVRSYGSAFLPPSWFSSADQKIRFALASAYNNSILHQMHVGLHFKARVLLFRSELGRNKAAYDSITEVPQYPALSGILEGLDQLQAYADQYNTLENPDDMAEGFAIVKRLAQYISGIPIAFGGEPHPRSLAGQSLQNVRNFQHFRLNELYADPARKRVTTLTEQWLDELFTHNALLQQVLAITNELDGLREMGDDPNRLLAALRDLQRELSAVDARLRRPEWAWVAKEELAAIPDFQRFFAKVATTPLLGKEYSVQLYDMAQAKFEAFRQRLLGLRSNLGGSVLYFREDESGAGTARRPQSLAEGRDLARNLSRDAAEDGAASADRLLAQVQGPGHAGPALSEPSPTPKAVDAEAQAEDMAAAEASAAGAPPAVAPAEPAASFRDAAPLANDGDALARRLIGSDGNPLGLNAVPIQIKADLADLMQQPFMQQLPFDALQTELQSDAVVHWQAAPLQRAVQLAQGYKDFISERLPQMTPQVQETVTSAGELRLRHNLQSLIGKAQEIRTIRTQSADPEARLMEGVQNFTEAMPLLQRLIEVLETLPRNSNLVRVLRQFLTEEGHRLLSLTDQLLRREALFLPTAGAFAAWDGVGPLSRAVYGAADQEELDYYLAVQRARLAYLADQYAEPVLQFLDAQQGYAAKGFHLMPKWQAIRQELEKYRRKQAASAVGQLEEFILFGMDKIDLGNCFTDLKQGRVHARRDYFSRTLGGIQQRIFDQCIDLAETNAAESYANIRSAFNQALAGRFPFASPAVIEEKGKTGEVRMPQIREFFGLLTDAHSDLQAVLPHTRSFGGRRDLALGFLEQLNAVRSFLAQSLGPEPQTEAPGYEFSFDFRVNREHEAGANQIIDWRLEVGERSVKRVNGEWKGVWRYGDPIRLSMRWARNSPYRPYWDGATHAEALRIEGEDTAVFEFHGNWALLELFARLHADPNDTPDREQPDPALLKLQVPVLELISAVEKGTIKPPQDGPTDAEAEAGAQAAPGPAEDAPELIRYQGRYHELFTQPEEAVVFARMNLLASPDQAPVEIPRNFPRTAPSLAKGEPEAMPAGSRSSRAMPRQGFAGPARRPTPASDTAAPTAAADPSAAHTTNDQNTGAEL